MTWKYRLADRFAPEPFYLVRSNELKGSNDKDAKSNSTGTLKRISWPERIAHTLRTGKLPRSPKLALVSSGGSCKAYYVGGIIKKLDELGIPPDNYFLNSATALLSLYAFGKDIKTFLDFALEVPEMIKVDKRFKLRDMVEYNMIRASRNNEEKSLRFIYNASRRNSLLFRLDEVESALRPMLQIDGRDVTIGETENITLMATDMNTLESVALGPQLGDMPLYRGIVASMSAMPLFRPVEYVNVNGDVKITLADGGITYNIPLLDKLMPSNDTVIAVDLNYRNSFSDLENRITSHDTLIHIKEMTLTKNLVEGFSGSSPEYLLERGDTENHRLLLLFPQIALPPYSIRIPMKQRKEILKQGYDDMESSLRHFRLA